MKQHEQNPCATSSYERYESSSIPPIIDRSLCSVIDELDELGDDDDDDDDDLYKGDDMTLVFANGL